jgi:hypothetical protein
MDGADVQESSICLHWRGWVGIKATTGFLLLMIDLCGGIDWGGMVGGLWLVLYILGWHTLSNTLVAEDHPRCFL